MVLNQLQMRRTLKAGVYCTFLLGLITIAFSLTRFLTLYDPTGSRFPSFSLVGSSPLTFPTFHNTHPALPVRSH
jgi:hypothetical protein